MEVSPGIYQVRVPVPFPLKDVNCYLVREADGWTMIDSGLHYGPAFEAWDAAFRDLQIAARDIRRIYLTHAHPDHYGLAGHFQRLSDAPVIALDEEVRVVPIEWEAGGAHMRVIGDFLGRHGVPEAMSERIVQRSLEVLRMIEPHPVLTCVHEGDEVTAGGRTYRVIWTPGHADGHMILHDEASGLVFGGDHILMKITPNIGLWPGLDADPLHSYLKSLEKVARLAITMVLPGHRASFQNMAGRIAELRVHHAARCDECQAAAADGHTAYEICAAVFPRIESVDDVRLAMVEVLAHLEYLVSEGRLKKEDGQPVRYLRAACGTRPENGA